MQPEQSSTSACLLGLACYARRRRCTTAPRKRDRLEREQRVLTWMLELPRVDHVELGTL